MSNPAETYEREMVPVLFEPWALKLLDFAAPVAGARILDIACGTGIVARRAARLAGRDAKVTGIDLNPKMVAVARAAAEREGATIAWHEGDARSLSFDDGAFDIAFCQQGLQFVPDRVRAVAEMARVLKPGGRLVLALWHGLDRHPLFAAMNDVIHRHFGEPLLAIPFSLGDPEAIRALLDTGGFRDIEFAEHSMDARFPDPARYAAMQVEVISAAIPAAQNLDDAARATLLDAVRDEFATVIKPAIHDNHVVVPMHAMLVRAARS